MIRPEALKNIALEYPGDLRAQTLRVREFAGEALTKAEAAELRARKLMPGCSDRLAELLVGHALSINIEKENKELMQAVKELARRLCPDSAKAQAIKCRQILGQDFSKEETAIVDASHLYPNNSTAQELLILKRTGRATKEELEQLKMIPDTTEFD